MLCSKGEIVCVCTIHKEKGSEKNKEIFECCESMNESFVKKVLEIA